MKIQDKEQERKEYQNSPQGKRKSFLAGLILFLFMAALLGVVYVMDHNPAYTGTPYKAVVDGFEIIPGETTGAQLYEAGFQLADQSMFSIEINGQSASSGFRDFFPLETKLEKRSYVDGLSLIQDGHAHAHLEMVNESSFSKTLAEAKVQGITVYRDDVNAEQASLEGISTGELSKQTLTERLGEPKEESTQFDVEGDRTELVWAKGNYKTELVLAPDGSFHSFYSRYRKN